MANVRTWAAAAGGAALVLIVAHGPVRADVIVSVSNEVNPIPTQSLTSGFYRPLASSFTVGSTSVWLESVVVPLGNGSGTQVLRDATIAIFSDASGKPNAAVPGTTVTLNYNINTAMANRTFNLAAPVTLSANTKYWFVLDQTVVGINDQLSTLRTVLSSPNTGILGSLATPNAGAVYNTPWVDSDPDNWTNASLIYRLNGTAVPEASSLIFLGACSLGVVGVAAWRRRTA